MAGVSTSTASRALDPAFPHVSNDVRERVRSAAESLGYRPDVSARATTTGSTAFIAVLVSGIRDPYNGELLHGVIRATRPAGYVVQIAGTDFEVEDAVRVIRELRGIHPRAIIVTGTRSGPLASQAALLAELDLFARSGGRVVVVGDDELPFDTVDLRRRDGARSLIIELAGLGYRRPALLIPEVDSLGAREWVAGVTDGVRLVGMAAEYGATARCPMTRDGGYAATAQLLRAGQSMDVVIAATDTMAVGAMAAIRDAGLRPGVDLGVAGFDDVVATVDLTPQLTSVDVHLYQAGVSGAELAMADNAGHRRLVQLEPRVVVRESTPGVA